ncbi:MAG: cell division protein FtsL [Casimicrobiaceae bacterium]
MVRFNLGLLAVLVLCALSLVTSRHQARQRFVDLERVQTQAHAYEVEFGQLQLEQSTWGTPARIEKIAREQLRMQLPGAGRVEVVDTRLREGAAP